MKSIQEKEYELFKDTLERMSPREREVATVLYLKDIKNLLAKILVALASK